MNYTKVTKTAEVYNIFGEGGEMAGGTEAANNAEYAVEHGEAVTIPFDGKKTIVPFHTIGMLKVTRTAEEAEKADPYGCDASANAITDKNGNVLTNEKDNPITV